MDATFIAVLLVLVVLILAPVLYATAAALRTVRDEGRLRLFEVLRGRDLPLPEVVGEASVRAAACAVRRCVGCQSQATCDQLAARRDWNALGAICPNRDYIDHLRAGVS